MEQFVPYGHAIVSMAAFALFGLLLSPLTAVAKMRAGGTSGGSPAEDYSSALYRFNRVYINLTENIGLFLGATLAAILAGADASWVNWLASIFLVSRLVLAAVHAAGIGPMNFGPRTFVFVVGWACSAILALMAIAAAF